MRAILPNVFSAYQRCKETCTNTFSDYLDLNNSVTSSTFLSFSCPYNYSTQEYMCTSTVLLTIIIWLLREGHQHKQSVWWAHDLYVWWACRCPSDRCFIVIELMLPPVGPPNTGIQETCISTCTCTCTCTYMCTCRYTICPPVERKERRMVACLKHAPT